MRTLGPALALVLLTATVLRADEQPVALIVHPDRKGELSTDAVAQIYLRRKRFWDDGTAIVPLNLPAGSPLRRRFSRVVLRQGDARLEAYWNRLYFDGILPPVTLASTEAVRRYVAADRNAIGYVPASEVDGTVRAILKLEE